MATNTATQFGTFKRNSLSEDIVDRLLSLIRERELRPGDKLPPERELAAMMEVSRPSLREALRALAIMNIIEIRQGDGTYVSSLEPKLLMAHLDFVFTLTDATYLELFEARRILEAGIVMLAAERITDEEIADLEACVERSAENIHNAQAILESDLELHETIAKVAKNEILEQFMVSIRQLGRVSRSRTVELKGVPEQSVQDHREIVQALKSRDPKAARRAMLRHLYNVETKLQQLNQEPAPNGKD